MSALDVVLTDFRSDVERAEHLLSLIKSFREFGASTPPEIEDGSGVLWSTAASLHEASKLRRTDLPVLSGSLQLYLAGRFEFCIRQIVETVSDEISSKVTKFTELPDVIQSELKTRTLEIAQNPRRYGYNDTMVDSLLASLVASKEVVSGPVIIKSSVLSLTDSNMKDRVLSDILKRVGVQDFWREIGKQATVKLELETSTDSETTAKAQSKLNAIMEERNQVAHPTATTQFPDPDQVLSSAAFLKMLASNTVNLAKIHLATYRPQAS
ncbi:HEPN domain-containing protein [Aeromonas caviae]|nr:HEPN domain-containing protein [Aeromonas caviae]